MTVRLRPKPGSIMADGSVIDYQGAQWSHGPCFIPNMITGRRKAWLGRFGWCKTPARDMPAIPPRQGLVCIHRERGTR